MRFSTIAFSAAIFGVAMAIPAQVVYETEVVTITSCAPEKTNCPGKTATATPVPSATETYTPPVVEPTSTTVVIPSSISYPNGTATHPVCPGSPHCPPVASSSAPATTAYPWTPSASAGIPSAPANTSTPVVPTTPPSFEGAASIKGFSFAAVAVAAAAFVLA